MYAAEDQWEWQDKKTTFENNTDFAEAVTEAWEKRKDYKERRRVCVQLIDDLGGVDTWMKDCVVEECRDGNMHIVCNNVERYQLNAVTLECSADWCVTAWIWEDQIGHMFAENAANASDDDDLSDDSESGDDDH